MSQPVLYVIACAAPPDQDDLAQLLYTSGTTAAPKGAMMTHGALLAEYESCIIEADHRSDDVVLAALPLYHSAQMHVFLMPQLLLGASITLEPAYPLQVAMAMPLDSRRGSSGFEIVSGAAPWVSPNRAPTETPKAAERASSEATDSWRMRPHS